MHPQSLPRLALRAAAVAVAFSFIAPLSADAQMRADSATAAPMPAAARGETFKQKIDRLLSAHPLMKMVAADVDTARETVGAERSAYFPRASLNLSAGEHEIDRDVGATGTYKPREQTVALNQLVTDFGSTRARVDAARAVLTKESREAELQRQNLLLAAVEAQLGLVRANEVVKFARQSEANIKRQTQLESGRMDAGRGYATDVLQAKSQLAGAEARRVVAERQLAEALNRYEAVFGSRPAALDAIEGLLPARALLPASLGELEQAVQLGHNPDMVAAAARTEVSRAEQKVQHRRELMPRVDLNLSRSRYDALDGVPGTRDDTKLMLRLNWTFDAGLRARYVDRSAAAAVVSAQEKAEYVRVQALEEVRNAWVSLSTARERVGYLGNQVAIAGSFLELGRKERELGRRSLLDLLSGETALINAQSDAMAARIDEVLATFRVLRAAGRMTPAVFELPGVVVPAAELTRLSFDGSAPAAATGVQLSSR